MPSEALRHPFGPVFDESSSVLVLGTFPSAASRGLGFYYGHPRNRFWPLLASIFDVSVPEGVDDKKRLLLSHGVALWDVLASCEIEGSVDASIKSAVPNDIGWLIFGSGIQKILLNGQKAGALFEKHSAPTILLPSICLPSTSPANAAWGFERLREEWRRELRPV